MRRLGLPLIALTLVSSLAFQGCGAHAAQPSTSELPREVQLTPGKPLRVDGTPLTLTLEAVEEDSRCPEGVNCVWAGDVVAEVRIEGGGASATNAALHLNLEPREVSHGKYRVTLTAVTPHPKADQKIPPGEYRVALRVAVSSD